MNKEEVQAKLDLVRIDTQEKILTLEECLNAMSKEGFEKLYKFYDVFGENKKTKRAKINYLVREIPSQFFDDFSNMMSNESRKLIIKICNNEKVKLDSSVWFAQMGYIYMNNNDELILPLDLYYFLVDFFI